MEINLDEYNLISLGENCTIPLILKDLELRKKSFPFDWIVCRYQQQLTNVFLNICLLQNLLITRNPTDCADKLLGHVPFQIENNKVVSNNPKDDGTNINYLNNIWFPHESKNPDEIEDKYQRRFKRLLDCLDNEKNVLIVYCRLHMLESMMIEHLVNLLKLKNSENKLICIFGSKPSLYEEKKIESLKEKDVFTYYVPYLNPEFKKTYLERCEGKTSSSKIFEYDFTHHRPLLYNLFIDIFKLNKEKQNIDLFINPEVTTDMYNNVIPKPSYYVKE